MNELKTANLIITTGREKFKDEITNSIFFDSMMITEYHNFRRFGIANQLAKFLNLSTNMKDEVTLFDLLNTADYHFKKLINKLHKEKLINITKYPKNYSNALKSDIQDLFLLITKLKQSKLNSTSDFQKQFDSLVISFAKLKQEIKDVDNFEILELRTKHELNILKTNFDNEHTHTLPTAIVEDDKQFYLLTKLLVLVHKILDLMFLFDITFDKIFKLNKFDDKPLDKLYREKYKTQLLSVWNTRIKADSDSLFDYTQIGNKKILDNNGKFNSLSKIKSNIHNIADLPSNAYIGFDKSEALKEAVGIGLNLSTQDKILNQLLRLFKKNNNRAYDYDSVEITYLFSNSIEETESYFYENLNFQEIFYDDDYQERFQNMVDKKDKEELINQLKNSADSKEVFTPIDNGTPLENINYFDFRIFKTKVELERKKRDYYITLTPKFKITKWINNLDTFDRSCLKSDEKIQNLNHIHPNTAIVMKFGKHQKPKAFISNIKTKAKNIINTLDKEIKSKFLINKNNFELKQNKKIKEFLLDKKNLHFTKRLKNEHSKPAVLINESTTIGVFIADYQKYITQAVKRLNLDKNNKLLVSTYYMNLRKKEILSLLHSFKENSKANNLIKQIQHFEYRKNSIKFKQKEITDSINQNYELSGIFTNEINIINHLKQFHTIETVEYLVKHSELFKTSKYLENPNNSLNYLIELNSELDKSITFSKTTDLKDLKRETIKDIKDKINLFIEDSYVTDTEIRYLIQQKVKNRKFGKQTSLSSSSKIRKSEQWISENPLPPFIHSSSNYLNKGVSFYANY
jgi:hypothetical protein